jgi:hypothetical protein
VGSTASTRRSDVWPHEYVEKENARLRKEVRLLREEYKFPLRQTQKVMRGVAKLIGLDVSVPDFSTLSRRSNGLKIRQNRWSFSEPVTLIVGHTGLKTRGGSN